MYTQKFIKFSYETRNKSKEKIKVIFDNSIIATVRGSSINSGISFVEGTSLSFKAQLQDGKVVESWFLNDVEQKEKGNMFEYTLNVNDAKGESGNKSITVKFSEKVAKEIVLKFDETVFAEIRKNGETIEQNTKVLDGTQVFFVLKEDAEKEKVVDYITTNGAKNDAFERRQGPYGTIYIYDVDIKDSKDEGGKPTIIVGAIFKDVKKAILKFDSTTIMAWLGEGPGAKEIQDGVEVKENDFLQFIINKNSDKIAEKWFVNGKQISQAEVNVLFYVVSAEDMKMEGGKNVLHVTAELRESKKFTIKFADEITCSEMYDGTDIVANGSEVKENQDLYFSAKQPSDKIFENWLINGMVKREYSRDNSFRYIVGKKDANSENVIEVSLSSHTRAKAKLKLLKNDIQAEKEENGSFLSIHTESEVMEGERLNFSVNYYNFGGNIIDVWLINGEEFVPDRDDTIYGNKSGISFYLNAERIKKEGSENIIKVDYRVKEPKKAKLILQKDFIEARGNYEKLANGAQVSEGDTLSFNLKNDDKIVKKWFVNGREFSTNSSIYFVLKENQIIKEDGIDVIKIDCEVRDAKKIKIEYDTDKIVKDPRGGIDSGAKVKEGDTVYFKTKPNILAKNWLVNGKHTQNWSDLTSFQYMVRVKDAIEKGGELVVVISIAEKGPVECSILFDSDKIECKNGSKDVASEEKVLEGTVLTFKAKGLSESQVIKWKVNYKPYGSASADEPLRYKVNERDIGDYNGKKVIRVWYELE